MRLSRLRIGVAVSERQGAAPPVPNTTAAQPPSPFTTPISKSGHSTRARFTFHDPVAVARLIAKGQGVSSTLPHIPP